jgi:2-haloacid dehalogenase
MNTRLASVKAIVFDTFGTVVDWRGSIARDLAAWGTSEGIDADWTHMADAWRARYQPQLDRVRSGAIGFVPLDILHDEALGELLPQFGLEGRLTPAQRAHVNRVWHRLDPWPDAVAGLARLKRRYVIGPLSNGNISLLIDLAKRGGLPWDAIFSAEHFQRYKPHPETYLGVARQLDLAPGEVMMCAAHNGDLRAARAVGLATGFFARPSEHGPAQATDLEAEETWDVIASDIEDLAARMGC